MRGFRRSAASGVSSRPSKAPKLDLRSGCRNSTGTARSRCSATEATAPQFPIPRWPTNSSAATRLSRQTRATTVTIQTSQAAIPRRSSIGRAARSMSRSRQRSRLSRTSMARPAAMLAYSWGCSAGGQQALSEAQRYPSDFNGTHRRRPGGNRTVARGLSLAVRQEPPRCRPQRYRSAREACTHHRRGRQGVPGQGRGGAESDAFLTDPEACGFRPDELLCKRAAAPESSDP